MDEVCYEKCIVRKLGEAEPERIQTVQSADNVDTNA